MSTTSILGGTSYNQQYSNLTYPTSATTTISGTSVTGINYPSTTITTATNSYTWNIPKECMTVEQSGKVLLTGDDPDIMIGDISLKDTLTAISERLELIRPRPDLEERWKKLADARKHYEECLADVIDKENIINILKK